MNHARLTAALDRRRFLRLAGIGTAGLLARRLHARGRRRTVGSRRGPAHIAKTTVPDRPVDVILTRPTGSAVTASVLAYSQMQGTIAFGTRKDALRRKTPITRFRKGEPVQLVLTSLTPNTRYHYQLRSPAAGGLGRVGGTFHTQRSPGSGFVFTITADPHLDQNTDPRLYAQALRNALADQPDFHIDLGDTFMTGKYRGGSPLELYLAERYYFGLLCHSAPLFFVLGNHDGEPGGRGRSRTGAVTLRKEHFPNPVPDGFYTGNCTEEPGIGPLEDYYAWEWGDALFVVLDPFWYTGRPGRGGDDNWHVTLGSRQYQWLKRTLETSKVTFKLVFIHYLVGGFNKDGRCRGGIEAAPFFEWGGRDADGRYAFNDRRPGWPMPIHKLLVRGGVDVVFHGHDHFFAKQELDGIVYQLVPQPGHPGRDRARNAGRYGYVRGDFLGSSGHLRVSVSPKNMTVDYVRSRLVADERNDRKNAAVDYSYTIAGER